MSYMSFFGFLLPGVAAAVLAFLLTPVVIRLAGRVGALDLPGPRKIHSSPIPRLGGLAVVTASAAVIIAIETFGDGSLRHFWAAVGLGLIPILIVSVLDDIRPLPAAPKFLAQLLGAGIAVAGGISLDSTIHLFGEDLSIGVFAIPLSLLWLVGVTNAFNIIDGLDGLSAGLALISAASLAGISVVVHRYDMAVAAGIVGGALVGFLPFNLYPARVFMGDTGATAVGFALGALALSGGSTLSAGMAVLVPVVVLGLPIAETLISMARRALRGQSGGGMFAADGQHIHHILLSRGLTQRRVALLLYGVGVVLAGCAIGSMFLTYRNAALLLLTLVLASIVGVQKLGYNEFAFLRRGALLHAYDVPVLRSTLFVVFYDVFMVCASLYLAIAIKYDDWAISQNRPLAHALVPILPAAFLACALVLGLYRGSWRLASIDDLWRPTATVLAAAVVGGFGASLLQNRAPSITLMVLFALVLLLCINGSRVSYRVLLQYTRRSSIDGEPFVVYGAGVGGTMAVREALMNPALSLRPVGFVDDNPDLKGRYVNGYPVLGPAEAVSQLLAVGTARGVVVASEKIPETHLDRMRAICAAHGAWMSIFRVNFVPVPERTGVAEITGARLPILPGTTVSSRREAGR